MRSDPIGLRGYVEVLRGVLYFKLYAHWLRVVFLPLGLLQDLGEAIERKKGSRVHFRSSVDKHIYVDRWAFRVRT
jgi:hypothetical protein